MRQMSSRSDDAADRLPVVQSADAGLVSRSKILPLICLAGFNCVEANQELEESCVDLVPRILTNPTTTSNWPARRIVCQIISRFFEIPPND